MRILKAVLDDTIDHCLKEYPLQACGMLAADDMTLVMHVPMRNAGAWPYGFRFDGLEQMKKMDAIEDEYALRLGAIYHVHLTSRAYPTSKDTLRHFYKDALCMIVSLLDVASPEVRAFFLGGGGNSIREESLEVVNGAYSNLG